MDNTCFRIVRNVNRRLYRSLHYMDNTYSFILGIVLRNMIMNQRFTTGPEWKNKDFGEKT